MLNPLESTQEIKKYLRKLLRLIENEASFTFFTTKLVDKGRVDDIICCVEASFSEEYKTYIRKLGGKNLRSYRSWQQALKVLKNSFKLSGSLYSIKTADALRYINEIISEIDSDYKTVYEES